jgi:tetratricopeptide (TPR) repeat protein
MAPCWVSYAFVFTASLILGSLTPSLVEVSAIETSDAQVRLNDLLSQKNDRSADPAYLLELSEIYLDLGDDPSMLDDKRISAYQEGARLAGEAIDLREHDAEAHYLYAANVGSAAQLKGIMASALTIRDLKRHVRRALELNPNHPAALHMMGMMLEELPWFFGGDADGALSYLRRAVAADPTYDHARLDLAKAYVKRKDTASARREVDVLLQQPPKPKACAAEERHRQEALQLKSSLSSR